MGKKLKTCIIGDTEVGKTSLIIRIIENAFNQNVITTIGVDYKYQNKTILGEEVGVQLWDTSGQDRFRSVAKNFFRGSDGVFLVFSLTSEKSAQSLIFWANELKENLDPGVPRIILGNKSDLKGEPSAEAQNIIKKLCSEENYSFYKVSAKTGANIKGAYQQLLQQALRYKRKQAPTQSVLLPDQKKKKKEKGCC